jgi:hypothetical protein
MRSLVVLVGVALALGCGSGDVESPPSVDAGSAPGLFTPDAGSADAGCGLSFDEAVEAYAPERVCQTTVYDLATGYCTHWVACSSL